MVVCSRIFEVEVAFLLVDPMNKKPANFLGDIFHSVRLRLPLNEPALGVERSRQNV